MSDDPSADAPAELIALQLAELAPAMPQVTAVIQDERVARWAIEFDEGLVVVAELDEPARFLVLTAELGAPAAEHRLAVCEAILTHACIRPPQDDIVVAAAGPGGAVVQRVDLGVTERGCEALQARLGAFAAKAALWRRAIECWSVEGERNPPPPFMASAR